MLWSEFENCGIYCPWNISTFPTYCSKQWVSWLLTLSLQSTAYQKLCELQRSHLHERFVEILWFIQCTCHVWEVAPVWSYPLTWTLIISVLELIAWKCWIGKHETSNANLSDSSAEIWPWYHSHPYILMLRRCPSTSTYWLRNNRLL